VAGYPAQPGHGFRDNDPVRQDSRAQRGGHDKLAVNGRQGRVPVADQVTERQAVAIGVRQQGPPPRGDAGSSPGPLRARRDLELAASWRHDDGAKAFPDFGAADAVPDCGSQPVASADHIENLHPIGRRVARDRGRENRAGQHAHHLYPVGA
jgi:hypothetical protein